MFHFLFVFFVAVGASSGSPITPLILGGSDANITDFPYMLSIELKGTGHYCGAVIVSADWALTDAWCSLDPDIRDFSVRSGSDLLYNGTVHSIVRWIHHPDSNVFYNLYDFAMIQVDPPFEFGENVAAVTLPAQDEDAPDGSIAQIAGFGERYEGSGNLTNERLQVASLELYNLTACKAYINSLGFEYSESELCARDPNEQVANCWRDEGGPLVVDGILFGITVNPGRCAQTYWVQKYARVASIRNWIDETVAG